MTPCRIRTKEKGIDAHRHGPVKDETPNSLRSYLKRLLPKIYGKCPKHPVWHEKRGAPLPCGMEAPVHGEEGAAVRAPSAPPPLRGLPWREEVSPRSNTYLRRWWPEQWPPLPMNWKKARYTQKIEVELKKAARKSHHLGYATDSLITLLQRVEGWVKPDGRCDTPGLSKPASASAAGTSAGGEEDGEDGDELEYDTVTESHEDGRAAEEEPEDSSRTATVSTIYPGDSASASGATQPQADNLIISVSPGPSPRAERELEAILRGSGLPFAVESMIKMWNPATLHEYLAPTVKRLADNLLSRELNGDAFITALSMLNLMEPLGAFELDLIDTSKLLARLRNLEEVRDRRSNPTLNAPTRTHPHERTHTHSPRALAGAGPLVEDGFRRASCCSVSRASSSSSFKLGPDELLVCGPDAPRRGCSPPGLLGSPRQGADLRPRVRAAQTVGCGVRKGCDGQTHRHASRRECGARLLPARTPTLHKVRRLPPATAPLPPAPPPHSAVATSQLAPDRAPPQSRYLVKALPNAQRVARCGVKLGLATLPKSESMEYLLMWLRDSLQKPSVLTYEEALHDIAMGCSEKTALDLHSYKKSIVPHMQREYEAGNIPTLVLEQLSKATSGLRFNEEIGTFHVSEPRDDAVGSPPCRHTCPPACPPPPYPNPH